MFHDIFLFFTISNTNLICGGKSKKPRRHNIDAHTACRIRAWFLLHSNSNILFYLNFFYLLILNSRFDTQDAAPVCHPE